MADYWRQLDIVPIRTLQGFHVNIIGAGGIGSPTAIALAKMGVGTLTIWDDDKVEEHNLPNQFHRHFEVGEFKSDALYRLVHDFVGDEVNLHLRQERLTDQTLGGIVVAAVDSMESRKAIWEASKASLGVELYIDPRMGGQMLRLYTVNPHDPISRKEYEATLYGDEDAMHLPCTAQSIIYTGMMAGSLVANSVKRFAADETAVFEVIFDFTSFTLLSR